MKSTTHDPILLPVRALRETRVPHAVDLFTRILVEHAAAGRLSPVLHVHRVLAYELQLAEAVVSVVGAGGAVDYELLAGGGVRELLRAFVGGEAHVVGAAVRGLFPGLRGDGDDLTLGKVGGDGPGVGH